MYGIGPAIEPINRARLEQLKNVKVPREISEGDQERPPFMLDGKDKKDILRWVKEQKEVIEAVRANQGISGDQVDFRVAMFNLLESTAVYFRNDVKTAKAILYAQKNEMDKALELLGEAQKDIEEIAEAMGGQFTVLCDFVERHPNDHWTWNGAFLGAFTYGDSTEPRKPFISIAGKGTDNWREWVVDAQYKPIKAEGDTVFGAMVHEGFYTGMFGKFSNDTPYDTFLQNLLLVCKYMGSDQIPTHITGHSLGSAYATLAYAETIRRFNNTNTPVPFDLINLYPLASPRVGEMDLATNVLGTLKPTQHAWRICNYEDVVTTVPPPKFFSYPYIHLDWGWKIKSDEKPVQMESEVKNPSSAPHMKGSVEPHKCPAYYASLCFALSQA